MGRGVAAAVLASFLLAGQQPSRPLTPAEATRAILQAEDRRIELPLDIRTPVLDTLRQRQEFDLRLLMELARGASPDVQRRAFLALGRHERRELTPEILQSLYVGPAREVAFALAQSMRGPVRAGDQQGIQLRGVFEALLTVSRMDPRKAAPYIAPAVRSVGRLPYESADQVQGAHAFLLHMMERVDPDPDLRPILADIADAVETLTRQHRRFAVAATETIGWLKRIAEGRRRTYAPDIRLAAMRALVTAREVDTETIRTVVGNSDPRMRRLATLSLAGGGSDIVDTERSGYLADLLQDAAPIVRIEALRAWARHETPVHGCQRLTEAAAHDRDMNVRIVAIGLLADACPGDADVTQALTSLTRAPKPPQWHAEAHALVALARRAPARAEVAMRLFVKESSWQLRMYTARAAGILDDLPVLERLAYDPHHNVREATLAHLKRLKGQEAEPFFADALRQVDYQLLRTAARELGDLAPTPALTTLLASALTRVTAERRETSRDTRLALLERLAAFDAGGTHVGTLMPLLKDYDIEVARAAAAVLAEWTGSPQEIAPELLPRPAPVLVSAVILEVSIAGAGSFDIVLNPDVAPLTSRRFLQLVSQGYYNGLTFHRVVPNFVIQGGSPGANEYAGDSIYTRDERSWVSHQRGTVGLSTRGRDTGDMQFFINLVDNPRLDYEYTVFGHVPAAGMAAVDRIAEGAEMSIRLKPDDKQ